MNELARRVEPVEAKLSCAVVTEAHPEQTCFTVEQAGHRVASGLAESCLLRPEVGDEVLLAETGDGRAFITAVLERTGDAARRLEVRGDAELRAASGRLDVTARDGMALRTPGELNLTAAGLGITAAVGRVMVGNLTMAGKLARVAWDQVRLRAASADTSVDRLMARFKLRSTKVDGLDRQEAQMLQQEVRGVHTIQNDYTVMRSREDMRMDAKQIIMG